MRGAPWRFIEPDLITAAEYALKSATLFKKNVLGTCRQTRVEGGRGLETLVAWYKLTASVLEVTPSILYPCCSLPIAGRGSETATMF